jgi:hypothetical protein
VIIATTATTAKTAAKADIAVIATGDGSSFAGGPTKLDGVEVGLSTMWVVNQHKQLVSFKCQKWDMTRNKGEGCVGRGGWMEDERAGL